MVLLKLSLVRSTISRLASMSLDELLEISYKALEPLQLLGQKLLLLLLFRALSTTLQGQLTFGCEFRTFPRRTLVLCNKSSNLVRQSIFSHLLDLLTLPLIDQIIQS